MPESSSLIPVLAASAPLLAALGIVALPRTRASVWSTAAALATFLLTASLAPLVLAGEKPSFSLIYLAPGVELSLRADALGLTFALLASGLWIVTTFYTSGYAHADGMKDTRRFQTFFAVSISAALGVAFAGDLLTFLIFYEALTLVTYPLVAHRETPAALAAGRRYLAYALPAGLALTVAVVWTWSLTGSLEFVAGGMLEGHASGGERGALLVLFLAAAGVKAAIMPLHAWLPAAMVAPAPVSALLHAVAVVKAGVFACLRIIGFVFGPTLLDGTPEVAVLAAACAVTMVVGSLIAIAEDSLKRRLAFSTIVHLSYMVLGSALLAPVAFAGSVLHMANHGLAKITLFLCVGAIQTVAGVDKLSELGGLARRMPWTFAALSVAALGLAGVPGLCGFAGKLLLARGAADAGEPLFLAVMIGGSVLSVAYLLPILKVAYLDAGPPGAPRVRTPRLMLVPLVVTAGLVAVFGFLPPLVGMQYDLAALVAAEVFGGERD